MVLEANTDYWDATRLPRLYRIIFDNTLAQQEAVELVKTSEGRVDLVTGLSPLETLRVAQSPFAKVVKTRGSLGTVFGLFNMRKTGAHGRMSGCARRRIWRSIARTSSAMPPKAMG